MVLDVETIAETLIDARRTGRPLDAVVEDAGRYSIADAVRVQQEVLRRKVAEGDRVVGFKLGNIAKAMQAKFGVDQPDFGPLVDSLFRPENLRIEAGGFIAPFVELEPAFVLKHDLGGADVTLTDVISATDYVLPSLEIIDSRVRDWKITIFETLCDGGSTGAVILGAQPRKLSELNLSDTAGEIFFDDEKVAEGNTAAIYGNPVAAVAWLCRRMAEFGVTFKAGQVILPGSCLAAVKLVPGRRVTGRFAGWADVAFDFTAG